MSTYLDLVDGDIVVDESLSRSSAAGPSRVATGMVAGRPYVDGDGRVVVNIEWETDSLAVTPTLFNDPRIGPTTSTAVSRAISEQQATDRAAAQYKTLRLVAIIAREHVADILSQTLAAERIRGFRTPDGLSSIHHDVAGITDARPDPDDATQVLVVGGLAVAEINYGITGYDTCCLLCGEGRRYQVTSEESASNSLKAHLLDGHTAVGKVTDGQSMTAGRITEATAQLAGGRPGVGRDMVVLGDIVADNDNPGATGRVTSPPHLHGDRICVIINWNGQSAPTPIGDPRIGALISTTVAREAATEAVRDRGDAVTATRAQIVRAVQTHVADILSATPAAQRDKGDRAPGRMFDEVHRADSIDVMRPDPAGDMRLLSVGGFAVARIEATIPGSGVGGFSTDCLLCGQCRLDGVNSAIKAVNAAQEHILNEHLDVQPVFDVVEQCAARIVTNTALIATAANSSDLELDVVVVVTEAHRRGDAGVAAAFDSGHSPQPSDLIGCTDVYSGPEAGAVGAT